MSCDAAKYPTGWKPPAPWKIIARRGFGEAYVSCFYSARTYPEAAELAFHLLNDPPVLFGLPPWDSVEIREGALSSKPPRRGKKKRQHQKPAGRQAQTLLPV